METIKAIIFDLDGTLLDSVVDIAIANNKVLASRGLPVHSKEDYVEFIGNGARRLVQLALPSTMSENEETVDDFLLAYKKEYLENIVVESKLYNGIPELLEFLNNERIPIAINTNKPNDQTRSIAEILLSDYDFGRILGQTDEFPKKPSPIGALEIARQLQVQPNNILFVGDSEVDAQTASAANMQLVCVTWGYSLKQEMIDAGCTNFVSTPDELLSFIKERI